jgi:probable HAF family extracellular repeat protein
MTSPHRWRVRALLAAAALACGPLTAAAQARVTLELLVGPAGQTTTKASAINDLGQVAGWYQLPNTLDRAVVWQNGGGVTTLALPLANVDTRAHDINNLGQVVGEWENMGQTRALLWQPGGAVPTALGSLGGDFGRALGINDAGAVTGESRLADNSTRAFRWTSAAGMSVISPLSGGAYNVGQAIAPDGTVVGSSATGALASRAFIDGVNSLALDVPTPAGFTATGGAINGLGMVAGTWRQNDLDRPFTWSASAGVRLLDGLGTDVSVAGINDAGVVVGGRRFELNDGRAMMWKSDGTPLLLETLTPGTTLRSASDINNLAQIVGLASAQAYRLTLHPNWVGGDGHWADSTRSHWDFAGTGFSATAVGAVHDVLINPGHSVTVRGAAQGAARNVQVGGTAGQFAIFDLNGGTTTVVQQATVATGGVLRGSGRLQGQAVVQDGGRLEVGSGASMQLAGSLQNAGQVDVQAVGGTASLQVAAGWQNSGQANLLHADVLVQGGLVNSGRLNMAGFSQVAGAVNNVAGGRINVSGAAGEAVFWDTVVQNGTVTVTTGSTVSFFGLVTGAGSFAGAGAKHFAGGYQPGNSPALVTLEGAVHFDAGTLVMELGGTVPGSGHDKLVFTGGSVSLAAAGVGLDVQWWNGFSAQAGDRFDLFDWNEGFSPLSGEFASLALPALAEGLAWDTSALYATGELVVGTVPEPHSALLMLAGLLCFGARLRSRTA